VYYRYINPAIVYALPLRDLRLGADLVRRTPETFDIVSKTVDVSSRKNLAQISRVLTQIAGGTEFREDTPIYVPINDYVTKAVKQFGAWLMEGMCEFTQRCPGAHAFSHSG
jgi:Ras GTPase-activating-like protein IQGAP2/3